MSLVERKCPLCGSARRAVVLRLKQEDFTRTNPTYRLDHLPRLGLDPEQEYPIVRCADCAMVYSLYHLDDAGEATVYNEIIDEEASRAKVTSLSRKRGDLIRCSNLLSLVEDTPDLRLLDYGCGWGSMLRLAGGLGITAVGFDATSWKTDWARKHGVKVVGTREEVENEGPFDLLVCTSVLEHLRDPAEAVAWMSRVVKPGGAALIDCIVKQLATPDGQTETQRLLASGQPLAKEINPWEHLNYFSTEQLRQLLASHGFEPADPTGRWIPNGGGARDVLRLLRRQLALTRGNRQSWGYWRFLPASRVSTAPDHQPSR